MKSMLVFFLYDQFGLTGKSLVIISIRLFKIYSTGSYYYGLPVTMLKLSIAGW